MFLKEIKSDTIIEIDSITRFEVIDDTGRAYVKYNTNVLFSLQDDKTTLKIFIKNNKE